MNRKPMNISLSVAAVLLLFIAIFHSSCKKVDHIEKFFDIDKKLFSDGYVSPLGVVAVPDYSGRLFVIDQVGKIWVLTSTGDKLPVPFMDISSRLASLNPGYDERGLLGFAFHPDYWSNGKFYIYYQLPPRAGGPEPGATWDNLTRISEFRASNTVPNTADMSTERILLELDDPQSNHNGGTLAFGHDNYLYISIGDGGNANDVGPGHVADWYDFNEGGNSQNIEANLFGKILRIDVNSGSPYGIPSTNPFANKPGLDEIYAYGFRNPYRFSFDMGGFHRLYVGDAGQNLYEEVSVVSKGGNYGWNVKEGTACFDAANPLSTPANCPQVDVYGNALVDPVIQLNNLANPLGGKATTVIGGNVYRGRTIPWIWGQYIFGTFSQGFTVGDGELFVSRPAGNGLWSYKEISLKSSPNDIGYFLKGFGQDNEGEIYLTVSSELGPTGTTGKVFKLVPALAEVK